MQLRSGIAASITAVLLAGCAGASVGLRTSAAPSMRGSAPALGSSYSSAAIHAEASANAYFGLLFFGYLAAGVHDSYLSWSDGPAWRKPPPLTENRAIAERDCSRPMETPSANLRCK